MMLLITLGDLKKDEYNLHTVHCTSALSA